MSSSSTVKILGFMNPLHSKAVPLITFLSTPTGLMAVYPDLSMVEIDPGSKDISALASFIPATDGRKWQRGQYSYIDADGDIITATPDRVLERMRLDLAKLNNEVHREMLKRIIETEDPTVKNGGVSLESVASRSSVLRKLIATDEPVTLFDGCTTVRLTRRTKTNGTIAPRIIIQSVHGNNWKTCYKKNLWSFDIEKEVLSRGILNRVNGAFKNLSMLYRINSASELVGLL